MNRLKPKMLEEKRRIIREKAGELGHIDCHYIGKDVILGGEKGKKYYLLGVVDEIVRGWRMWSC